MMKANKLLIKIIGVFTVCIPVVLLSGPLMKVGYGDSAVWQTKKAEAQVVIEHMKYVPETLKVVKGTEVTWKDNQSIIPHSVTSDNGKFESGDMHKGDVFTHVFNEAGIFTYKCTHHKKMQGVVIVK